MTQLWFPEKQLHTDRKKPTMQDSETNHKQFNNGRTLQLFLILLVSSVLHHIVFLEEPMTL